MLEDKVNHDTQFYRIKGGDGVPSPPPPITNTKKELMKFYESCCQHDQVHCTKFSLTLFDMGGGGGMMTSQNVFDHCAQTLRRRKLKLGEF